MLVLFQHTPRTLMWLIIVLLFQILMLLSISTFWYMQRALSMLEDEECSLVFFTSLQKTFGVAMASIKQMALMTAVLGVKSFILGIVAEHKKPASGSAVVLRGGGVICKYPSDPTVVLGFLSIASLTASVAFGFYSVLYPYKGKSIPRSALFKNTTFYVYFHIAVYVSLFSEGMLWWATITEHLHLTRNHHHNMDTKCPTAKTGLFGGGAFMALNACLFWLICLMLADNARDDYFDEQEENSKGEYGQVLTRDYQP